MIIGNIEIKRLLVFQGQLCISLMSFITLNVTLYDENKHILSLLCDCHSCKRMVKFLKLHGELKRTKNIEYYNIYISTRMSINCI